MMSRADFSSDPNDWAVVFAGVAVSGASSKSAFSVRSVVLLARFFAIVSFVPMSLKILHIFTADVSGERGMSIP
jgi:hypothetical protein